MKFWNEMRASKRWENVNFGVNYSLKLAQDAYSVSLGCMIHVGQVLDQSCCEHLVGHLQHIWWRGFDQNILQDYKESKSRQQEMNQYWFHSNLINFCLEYKASVGRKNNINPLIKHYCMLNIHFLLRHKSHMEIKPCEYKVISIGHFFRVITRKYHSRARKNKGSI